MWQLYLESQTAILSTQNVGQQIQKISLAILSTIDRIEATLSTQKGKDSWDLTSTSRFSFFLLRSSIVGSTDLCQVSKWIPSQVEVVGKNWRSIQCVEWPHLFFQVLYSSTVWKFSIFANKIKYLGFFRLHWGLVFLGSSPFLRHVPSGAAIKKQTPWTTSSQRICLCLFHASTLPTFQRQKDSQAIVITHNISWWRKGSSWGRWNLERK